MISQKNADIVDDHIVWYFLVFVGAFTFWSLFSIIFEDFYRDDNVGGLAPVYMEMARRVLDWKDPSHTYYFGGGGGAYLSLVLTGFYDPMVFVPAIAFRNDPQLMMNFIITLHIAFFALGGFYMASQVGAPFSSRLVAAVSLCFSGFIFVWGGNWSTIIIPHTFLPWMVGSFITLILTEDRANLIKAEAVFIFSLLGLFLTGLLFAAYFGGLVLLFVAAYLLLSNSINLIHTMFRLVPAIIIFFVIVVPSLLNLNELYHYLGARDNQPFHWVLFTVPLQAYLGLFLPNTYSIWRGPFYPNGIPITNILMLCGLVPVWFLFITLIRKPKLVLSKNNLPFLIGTIILIIFLSPNAFGLEDLFAQIPVLNAFRWPFRGIPALHVLLVLFFVVVATKDVESRWIRKRFLFPLMSISACLLALGIELVQAHSNSPVRSWYRAAPMLADRETWSQSTLDTLRKSGYVINACRSEGFFHAKPRIFIYGSMGAEMRIKTVHLYAAPPPNQYSALGMSIKGCITDLNGIKMMVESGPQKPLTGEIRWSLPFGPKNFYEIVEKTYVGAAIVENGFIEPLEYFRNSGNWLELEKKDVATVFVRKVPQDR